MEEKKGSGKPDPGRRYGGRSQCLKGGDFRGRRGPSACARFWLRLRDETPGGIQGKGGAAFSEEAVMPSSSIGN